MSNSKIYVLSLQINKITVQNYINQKRYKIKISTDNQSRYLPNVFTFQREKLVMLNEKIIFCMSSTYLKRQHKCYIEAIEERPDNSRQISAGKFQFCILDYKSYSKKVFKLTGPSNIIVHMSMNITSQSNKSQIQNYNYLAQIKSRSKLRQSFVNMDPDNINQENLFVTLGSNRNQSNMYAENSQRKSKRQQKSSSQNERSENSIMENKDNSQNQLASSFLLSKGELYRFLQVQEKIQQRFPTNVERIMAKTQASYPQAQSKYSKQICHNLTRLNSIDEPSASAPMNMKKSYLNIQNNQKGLYDNFARVINKFQRIHEHQSILNNEDQIHRIADEQVKMENIRRNNQMNLENHHENLQTTKLSIPALKRSKEDDFLLIDSNLKGKRSQLHLVSKTVNAYHVSKNKKGGVNRRIPDLKHVKNHNMRIIVKHGDYQKFMDEDFNNNLAINKRYKLIKYHGQNKNPETTETIEPTKEQNGTQNQFKTLLNQTYINYQVEEEIIQQDKYIKLNKISHLTKTADNAQKRNSYLAKANEQLMLGITRMQKKLQISANIIKQKEDIVKYQFQNLMTHMKELTLKLSLKNEESEKRQQKIESLLKQVQNYARETNQLKEDIQSRNLTIKEIKELYWRKEKECENYKSIVKKVDKNYKQIDLKILETSQNDMDESLLLSQVKTARYNTPVYRHSSQNLTERLHDKQKPEKDASQGRNQNFKYKIQSFNKSLDFKDKSFSKFKAGRNTELQKSLNKHQIPMSNTNEQKIIQTISAFFSGPNPMFKINNPNVKVNF